MAAQNTRTLMADRVVAAFTQLHRPAPCVPAAMSANLDKALRRPVRPLPPTMVSKRGFRRSPRERWMRRRRVELLVCLDFNEPQPRAFEQLVTVGRRRCCVKPSRQLAQLYRSFFISHRLTSPRGPRAARRAAPQGLERPRSRKLALYGANVHPLEGGRARLARHRAT